MAVTIQHIAQRLELAVSTVSKALNNYPDVSPETRQRVQEAARELGYYPSATARNLRRQRTEKIGFLFSFPVTTISEYVSKLISGAIIAAEKEGYNLILYPQLGSQVDTLTRICRAREVDGLLVLNGTSIQQSLVILAQENIPFVLVDCRAEQPDVSYVCSDHYSGALLIMRHLIALGHKRVAYTARSLLGITNRDRLAAYKQVLAEAGLPFDASLVVSTHIELSSGYDAMVELLNLPHPPTAVFAIHDLIALECLRAVTDRGLRVPEDVAIAGFDNWNFALTTKPPLTSIHTPLAEIGEQAVKVLLTRVNDSTHPLVRLTLPVELIPRQSTLGAIHSP
jgi:DNA-binding LacI/PurR family transcriptional regulator